MPDQVIALVALGLALGRQESAGRSLPIATLAAGLLAGLVSGVALVGHLPEALRALPLLLAGLLLIEPRLASGRSTAALICLVAVFSGLGYGVRIAGLPGVGLFLGAGAAVGTLLAVPGVLLWRWGYRTWFPIALRIVGSWLAAIGIILLGASFR